MVQMYSISALAETQRRVYTYQLKDLRRVSNYKKRKKRYLKIRELTEFLSQFNCVDNLGDFKIVVSFC